MPDASWPWGLRVPRQMRHCKSCSGGMHQLLYQIRLVKAAVLNVREKRPSAQFWLLESRRPRCPKRSRVLGAAMSHGKATCDLRTGGWGLRDQIRPRESMRGRATNCNSNRGMAFRQKRSASMRPQQESTASHIRVGEIFSVLNACA